MDLSQDRKQDKDLRNTLIILGLILALISRFIPGWFYLIPIVPGFIMILIGCFYWTKYKNISPWFTLFGIIAPLGFIPLMLIKAK